MSPKERHYNGETFLIEYEEISHSFHVLCRQDRADIDVDQNGLYRVSMDDDFGWHSLEYALDYACSQLQTMVRRREVVKHSESHMTDFMYGRDNDSSD